MNRKRSLFIVALAATTITFNACYYDKSEEVYPPNATACDTTSVTYGTDVVGILNANCYSCHSGSAINGSGIKLDTYTGVSTQAKFGSMLQVIAHVPGFSFMPKNGNKLSSCNIAVIRTWIRNGAPNN
ncbi:hypothetical protein BH10BAC3_BH10BAC3_13070 [soil metagenome]